MASHTSVRSTGLPIREQAPILFRLAKWLQHQNIRGGTRLEEFCRLRGLLDLKVRYRLNDRIVIDVPIHDRPYDLTEIRAYEVAPVTHLKRITGQSDAFFLLIDCGADIGLMTARLVSECPNIRRVVAFEPNPVSWEHLRHNLTLLGIAAQAMKMGVSDFTGKADLRNPEFDGHDHAAFIESSDSGSISITTIDALALPAGSNVLLKVDVEGEELAVMKGATRTFAEAGELVVVFEAHHRQVERTGIDPTAVAAFLNEIRPFRVFVAEVPDAHLDLRSPFFQQLPKRVYNVCAVALPRQ